MRSVHFPRAARGLLPLLFLLVLCTGVATAATGGNDALALLLESIEGRNVSFALASDAPLPNIQRGVFGVRDDDDDDDYPRPCIMKHGCECNSSAVKRYKDGQYYGVCEECDEGWNGPFCESALECLNSGVKEDDGDCSCPVYYTGPICETMQCPNSIEGEGKYSILPVDADTNMCEACNDDFNGINCGMCLSNGACELYSGSPSVCNSGIIIHGDNKQFQCSLDTPIFLSALGKGRNITAEVTLNCSSGTPGLPFARTSEGTCSMTIHRIEENNAYRSPFFHCSARSCSMSQTSVEVSRSSLENGTGAYAVLLEIGKVAMVTLCAVLAAIGGVARYIGRRTMRTAVYTATVALCVTCVAYIVIATIAMNATLDPAVAYSCGAVDCQCAEDPPSNYPPDCTSTLGETLSFIHGSLKIRCNAVSGACQLQLTDLPIPFDVNCRAAECINTAVFPDWSSVASRGSSSTESTEERSTNLLIFGFFLVLLIVSLLCVNVYQQRSRSMAAAKEFVDIFHLSVTVDTASTSSDMMHDAATTSGDTIDTTDGSSEASITVAASGSRNRTPTFLRGTADLIATSDFVDETNERAALVDTRRVMVRSPEQMEAIERTREISRSHFELSLYKLGYSLAPSLCGGDDDDEESSAAKHILQQVTFNVRSGELLAIMGPSGAGKTTLLDILSARAKQGEITGNMSLNATSILTHSKHTTQYRNIIGYVSQEDTLLPALTVKQTIRYAARLKLPMAFSNATIRNIIRQMITSLKLQQCANTLVGDGSGIRGISGGEKRRLSIAVELLANPRILFLDEPTSGLDAVSAMRTMEAVAELAKDSPMRAYAPYYFAFKPIVIFSIHQPSQEIFNMFDRVLLLSKGTTVYCGPASIAVETLTARMRETSANPNLSLPDVAESSNHAEVLMKLEERMSEGTREALLQYDPPDEEHRHPHAVRAEEESQQGVSPSPGVVDAGPDGLINSAPVSDVPGMEILQASMDFRRFYANTYEQMGLLTARAASCLFASFHLIVCHAGVTAVVSTLMCVLYSEQSLDLPGALNRAGSVTFLLLVVSFLSLSCLEQLVLERKLFVVERENGFYTTLPYLLSKVFVDIIPLRVLPVVVLASIIYFPMGMRTDSGIHFLWFLLVTTLFSICATLTTMCIGIFNASFGAAALLSSVFILWNFVFGGLLVQAETIPALLQPFKAASPFFLAFESLLVNELDGQACTFSPTDETGKESAISIPIVCRQYLSNIGLRPARLNWDIMLLGMYCVALIMLAWLLLAKFTSIVR